MWRLYPLLECVFESNKIKQNWQNTDNQDEEKVEKIYKIILGNQYINNEINYRW